MTETPTITVYRAQPIPGKRSNPTGFKDRGTELRAPSKDWTPEPQNENCGYHVTGLVTPPATQELGNPYSLKNMSAKQRLEYMDGILGYFKANQLQRVSVAKAVHPAVLAGIVETSKPVQSGSGTTTTDRLNWYGLHTTRDAQPEPGARHYRYNYGAPRVEGPKKYDI